MTGWEAAAIAVLSPLAQKAFDKAAEKLGEIVIQSTWDNGDKFLGLFAKSGSEKARSKPTKPQQRLGFMNS